jgi:hypothetical protein
MSTPAAILPVQFRIIANPYPHTIPDPEFNLLIATVARRLAAQIHADHNSLGDGQFGFLKRPSLGLCLMNPTLPRYTPARHAVMALIAIGDEGESYLVNGAGKAITHWEQGENCGVGAYADIHCRPDGSFVYGHSAEVNRTIAGASAASEQQDRALALRAASEFYSFTADARKKWQEAHPQHKWFCNDNEPRVLFTEVASWLHGVAA